MGFILSLLANPMAVLQMIGVGVVALVLGFGGGWVKGYDSAVAKYQVASLKQQVSDLEKAAEESSKILEEDAKSADLMEDRRSVLDAEIEKVLHAPNNRSDACRLLPEQLRRLRSFVAKSS
jgi:hypothetical protein